MTLMDTCSQRLLRGKEKTREIVKVKEVQKNSLHKEENPLLAGLNANRKWERHNIMKKTLAFAIIISLKLHSCGDRHLAHLEQSHSYTLNQ